MKDALKNDLKFREAQHLQALEGNPFDADDIAMFEMFEREGWSQEQRLAHIRERAHMAAAASSYTMKAKRR